jgi:hypothetical protein
MASQAADKEAPAHDESQTQEATPHKRQKELYPMVNWKYDLFVFIIGNLVDAFFKEVVPRGSWRVPQTGPVLFVAAPHANQVCACCRFPCVRWARSPSAAPKIPQR